MSIFSHLLYSFPFLDTYDASEAPDLTDRVFIVTGGTDGLGFETALALARKNAHVFITSRSLERGERCAPQMVIHRTGFRRQSQFHLIGRVKTPI